MTTLWHQYWMLALNIDVTFFQSPSYSYYSIFIQITIDQITANFATDFNIFFVFNLQCFSSLLKYFNCSIFTIHFSASCNSSTSSKLKLLIEKSNTFSDLLGIISFFYSVLIFHFSISAIIRFIFNQYEYFSSIFPQRPSSTPILFVFTCFFNSGSSGCNNTGAELISHYEYGFHKNFGP